jgi:dipeptidyl aminopeptidase/acylaminoacyl peptidase
MINKFVTLLAIATLSGVAPAGQEHRPLQIDEALGTLGFAGRMPIDLSPDGQWVAYTLEDVRRHESTADERYATYSRTGAYQEASGCDIWITNVNSGASRNLTQAKGTSWGPVWSPDGRRLAFYSDRGGVARLWIWDRDTDALREIPKAIVRPYFGFASVRWAPDSRRVLLKLLPAELTVETAAEAFAAPAASGKASAPGVTARVYEANLEPRAATAAPVQSDTLDPISPNPRYLSDIALIDVTTGEVDRIARDTRAIGYAISPDGHSVAYTTHVGHYPNTQDQHYDIVVVSLADRRPRVVAPRVLQQYAVTMSWAPDSRSLAYSTTKSQRGPIGEVYIVAIDGGSPRKISVGTHPDFASAYRAPLWSPSGDSIYLPVRDGVWQLSPDGSTTRQLARVPGHDVLDLVASGNNAGRVWTGDGGSLIAVTRDRQTKRMGFFRVAVATGQTSPLLEEEKYYGNNFLFTSDVSADGRAIVYVSESASHSPDIWVTDSSFRTPRRLTRINPHLDSVALGGSRLISWTAADGTTLSGALLLPSGYQAGARYPLIVKLYAGSFLSESVFRFGGQASSGVDNLQLLTTRGYAVLLPDVPLRLGSPMTDMPGAVLPGVDKVIALGIADPERLGITGHSYGGYSTLSMIVQTPRFAAAVDSAGPANLISLFGTMGSRGDAAMIGWSETGQGRMGGSPWEQRDRYLANSPILYLDRVETPLLIIQGALDRTVPPAQAEEVFVGLRRLGKPVAYARYEGEGHWQGTWGHANVVDYWTRLIGWFDRYLKRPRSEFIG